MIRLRSIVACAFLFAQSAWALDIVPERPRSISHTKLDEVITDARVDLLNKGSVLKTSSLLKLPVGRHVVEFPVSVTPMTVTGYRLSVTFAVPEGTEYLPPRFDFRSPVVVEANEVARMTIQIDEKDGLRTITALSKDNLAKPDTEKPSIPPSFSLTVASPTQVNLAWGAASDDVRVTGYVVYLNNEVLARVATTSFQHTGLTPATTYSYRVSAHDAVPNHGDWTTAISVTTP